MGHSPTWETSLSFLSLALKITLIIEIRIIFALFFRVESRARVVFITSHIFRQTHTLSLSLSAPVRISLSLSLFLRLQSAFTQKVPFFLSFGKSVVRKKKAK